MGNPRCIFDPHWEEIELRASVTTDIMIVSCGHDDFNRVEVLAAFEPFLAARFRAGRPVKVSWVGASTSLL
jgi:hypothetical protein